MNHRRTGKRVMALLFARILLIALIAGLGIMGPRRDWHVAREITNGVVIMRTMCQDLPCYDNGGVFQGVGSKSSLSHRTGQILDLGRWNRS